MKHECSVSSRNYFFPKFENADMEHSIAFHCLSLKDEFFASQCLEEWLTKEARIFSYLTSKPLQLLKQHNQQQQNPVADFFPPFIISVLSQGPLLLMSFFPSHPQATCLWCVNYHLGKVQELLGRAPGSPRSTYVLAGELGCQIKKVIADSKTSSHSMSPHLVSMILTSFKMSLKNKWSDSCDHSPHFLKITLLTKSKCFLKFSNFWSSNCFLNS